MAAATYIFRTLAWAGPMQDGIAGIFNLSDQNNSVGDVVNVREVRVRVGLGQSCFPGGTTQVPLGKLAFAQITAATGSNVVPPAQFSTADAAWPTQVQVLQNPSSITLAADLRLFVNCQQMNQGASNPGPMAWGLLNQSHLFRVNDAGGNVEPIVLNEGMGVAITQRAFDQPCVNYVELVLTNDVTSASYAYSTTVHSGENIDSGLVSVMNLSGSGVVVDVRLVNVPPFNQSLLTPLASPDGSPVRNLMLMDGFVGGTVSTPVSFNPNKPPPPSLQCVSGPFRAMRSGEGSGLPIDWYMNPALNMPLLAQQEIGRIRRQIMQYGYDASGNITPPMFPKDYDLMWKADPQGDGIVLAPGTGLAVTGMRDASLTTMCFDIYEVEFLFTAERPFLGGAPVRYSE